MKRSLIVAAAVVLALTASLWSQEMAKEWKLRVNVKSAAVYRERTAKSPVIAWSPQGTELKSTYYDGEWYMIHVATGQGGMVLPGYISRFDVVIVEEKTEKGPDYFEQSPDAFKGVGLTVKLAGGFNFFGSGDIDPGAKGMFDQYADIAAGSGYTIMGNNPKSFNSGPEGGADIVFRMGPKFSIGVGGSFIKAKADSSLRFAENSLNFQTMWNRPAVTAYYFRVEAYYNIPLLPWLGLTLHGGPAFFHADYTYSRDYETTLVEDNYSQQAKGNTLGLHGGLGLAVSLNARVAIVLEARGRYARFTDLQGSEKLMYSTISTFTIITENTGSLYAIGGQKYARLAVLSDAAAAGMSSAKPVKAVFDFSGISLVGGINIRF
jgi:hypothetical protein